MKRIIDAMGDVCPVPVVKTKKAIDEIGSQGGILEIFVDNEIAVQNLIKLGKGKGCSVLSEKMEKNKFRVVIEVNAGKDMPAETEPCIPDARKKDTVVVISSEYMGDGNPDLGKILMKSYIYALAQQDYLPSTLLFYNGGVKLVCENENVVEDLKSLEAQGVEILVCGTCLNFYGLTEKLLVGSVTNMYTIVEKMNQAALIIKP